MNDDDRTSARAPRTRIAEILDQTCPHFQDDPECREQTADALLAALPPRTSPPPEIPSPGTSPPVENLRDQIAEVIRETIPLHQGGYRTADAVMGVIGTALTERMRRTQITLALAEAWPHLANDPVHADQLAAVALQALGPELEHARQAEVAIGHMRDLIDSYPPGSNFAQSGAQALFRRTLDWHPESANDPDGDEQRLGHQLQERLGGDLWHTWDDAPTALGAELHAGYTRTEAGRLVLTGLVLRGESLTTDTIRRVPVVELENSINVGRDDIEEEIEKLPPLKREPGMVPEDFSELVALHYKTWARAVPHPAAAMAVETNTKLATVHTWIREARLRGLLPPAQRSKRGATTGTLKPTATDRPHSATEATE